MFIFYHSVRTWCIFLRSHCVVRGAPVMVDMIWRSTDRNWATIPTLYLGLLVLSFRLYMHIVHRGHKDRHWSCLAPALWSPLLHLNHGHNIHAYSLHVILTLIQLWSSKHGYHWISYYSKQEKTLSLYVMFSVISQVHITLLLQCTIWRNLLTNHRCDFRFCVTEQWSPLPCLRKSVKIMVSTQWSA